MNKKGFTLVEIMIVVVIIGLLAAMAIPAFQAVRVNAIGGTLENDARALGHAAQQYLGKNPTITEVTFTIDANGNVAGELNNFVKQISKGVLHGAENTIDITTNGTFSLTHAQYVNSNTSGSQTLTNGLIFNNEGKKL